MKKDFLFIILGLILLTGGIFFLFFYEARPPKEIPVQPITQILPLKLRAVMVIHQVKVLRNRKESPIQPGDLLEEEDIIVTGKASALEIQLEGKFRILIREKSLLKLKDLKNILIDHKKEKSLYSFSLQEGKILVSLFPLKKGETWNIRTPTLAIGVRGTQFVVEATRKTSNIKVKSGKVQASRNLEVPQSYENLISVEVFKEESVSVSEEENETVRQMIQAQRLELPKLTKEKVTRDADFRYLENYFQIRSAPKGALLKIFGTQGALVYLNGVFMGRGDFARYLEPGSYFIRVEDPELGRYDEQSLMVKAGETYPIRVNFKPRQGQPQEPGGKKPKML